MGSSSEWAAEPLGPVRGEHLGFRWEASRSGGASYGWVWCGDILVPEILAHLGDLEVHGGVTLHKQECPGVYRIGFDCGHNYDARADRDRSRYPANRGVFRTLQYVQSELESAAVQLTEIGVLHLGESALRWELVNVKGLLDLAEVLDLSMGTE